MTDVSNCVIVKQGHLKSPPCGREPSFSERWKRCWCTLAAQNGNATKYSLYFFEQRPANVLADIKSFLRGGTPHFAGEPMLRRSKLLRVQSLENCYYLLRCNRHTLYKNLFAIVLHRAPYCYLATDTRAEMDDWVLTFCEHLNINCEGPSSSRSRWKRNPPVDMVDHQPMSALPLSHDREDMPGDMLRPDSLLFVTSPSGIPLSQRHFVSAGTTNVLASGNFSSPSLSSGLDSSSPGTPLSMDGIVIQPVTSTKLNTAIESSPVRSSTNTPTRIVDSTTVAAFSERICSAQTPMADTAVQLGESSSIDTQAESTDSTSTRRLSTNSKTCSVNICSPDSLASGRIVTEQGESFFQSAALGCTPTDSKHCRSGSDISDGTPGKCSRPSTSDQPCNHFTALAVSEAAGELADSGNCSEETARGAQNTMPHRTPVILSGSIPPMVHPTPTPNSQTYSPFSYVGSESKSVPLSQHRHKLSSVDDLRRAYSMLSLSGRHLMGSRTPPPRAHSMTSVKLSVTVKRSQVVNRIILLDAFNYTWVGGWSPGLGTAFHFGDRVCTINGHSCSKASTAMTEIQASGAEVNFVVVRTPLANEVTIVRQSSSEILGIVLRKNMVTNIIPNSAASRCNLNLQAQGITGKVVPWVVTEINCAPVSIFCKEKDDVMQQLLGAGPFVTLLLHPKDFVKVLKKKLKTTSSYKRFLPCSSPRQGYVSDSPSRCQAIRVQLRKTKPQLGVEIKGGADTEWHNITIGSVDEHGSARDDGFLAAGMELIAVDSHSLVGLSHQNAVELIWECFTSQREVLELLVRASS